jgi:hypothetical protein
MSTQADGYFKSGGRYEQRVGDLLLDLRKAPEEEASNLLIKFLNNTKMHLAGFKLIPSDEQYLHLVTVDGVMKILKSCASGKENPNNGNP